MAVTRRRFLQDWVLTTATCFIAPFNGWATSRPRGGDSDSTRVLPHRPERPVTGQFNGIERLERRHFEGVIGSAFRVSAPGAQPIWLRLLAVNDLPSATPINPASMAVMPRASAPAPATSGFALSFAGTGSQQLAQGTHVFEHPQLGSFGLFVVSGTGPQQTSTAIVNRLVIVSANTLPATGTSGQPASISPATATSPAASPVGIPEFAPRRHEGTEKGKIRR